MTNVVQFPAPQQRAGVPLLTADEAAEIYDQIPPERQHEVSEMVRSLLAKPKENSESIASEEKLHRDDPIFGMIAAHRAAQSAHLAAIAEQGHMDKTHGVADWSITEKPCGDENDAWDILVGAPAITISGLVAKLDYLREIADGPEEWILNDRSNNGSLLVQSFAVSLRNAGVLT
jgi:hypothetical protein